MCRASLEEDDSDFDIDEANQGMFEAAFFDHFDIVHLMLFRGANNYNTGLMRGHLDIERTFRHCSANASARC